MASKTTCLRQQVLERCQKGHPQQNTNIQIVKPHNHRVNAEELAVKFTKYQMIAGPTTVYKDYLIQLWDKFPKQVKYTLSMLRILRTNTRIPAPPNQFYHNVADI